MSSPSKVKKLRKGHSYLWKHKHKGIKTKQGLFFNSNKYEIKINKSKTAKIIKLCTLKSIAHLSYIYAKYKHNNKIKYELLILDENDSAFFSCKKIKYITKSANYSLLIDPNPIKMNQQFLVPELKTNFDESSIESIKEKIINFSKEYNKNQHEKHQNDNDFNNDNDTYVPLLQRNTNDNNRIHYTNHADEVLAWENRINKIQRNKSNGPALDWINAQIKIFKQNGTLHKEQEYEPIIKNLNKIEHDAKQASKSNILSYKSFNLNKNGNNNQKTNVQTVRNDSNGKFPCVSNCSLSFNKYKKGIEHFALMQMLADEAHLNFDTFCDFWSSEYCSPNTYFFPTTKSKIHHQLFVHHKDIKKNDTVPNFSKKCHGCGEKITKWIVSRNGTKMGIRCNNCKFSYFIKTTYKKKYNKLSETEIAIIKAQFKSAQELREEFPGLRGEAPPIPIILSKKKDIETMSNETNTNNNNNEQKEENKNGNTKTKIICQVCKIMHKLVCMFENEDDLSKHISVLHVK